MIFWKFEHNFWAKDKRLCDFVRARSASGMRLRKKAANKQIQRERPRKHVRIAVSFGSAAVLFEFFFR